MLDKGIVRTPPLKTTVEEPDTESKSLDNPYSLSPPHPIKRIRDLPTLHKSKKNRTRLPLAKLAIEMRQGSGKMSEFFRCYLEDDIVDRVELRGNVQNSTGDDDQESEEEMVEEVKTHLMSELKRAILAAL